MAEANAKKIAEERAAQERRVAEQAEMTDMTPREGREPAPAAADSRMEAYRRTPPEERGKLVNLVYLGRKAAVAGWAAAAEGSYVEEEGEGEDDAPAQVSRVAGEHIDVIVPNRRNVAQSAAFLNMASPTGALTETQQKELIEAGIGPHTLHTSGPHYHFVTDEATPVKAEHVAWLLAHKGYAFRKADDKAGENVGAGLPSKS